MIRHSGFRFKKPYSQVLDLSEGLPFAKWCIGATTNFTLSCLERNIEEGRGAKTFLVWQGEDGRSGPGPTTAWSARPIASLPP
ncbi:MAG: acetate--CoA ligase [Sphingomonadales bacterium]|nr:acetate--CoA ligase [Sphingomonadales bacterium]